MSQFSETEEQEKVKGIPLLPLSSPLSFLSFFPFFSFKSWHSAHGKILPTCLLLLHLSPIRFLKIAKNTEFLSPKNKLTGKKRSVWSYKNIYLYCKPCSLASCPRLGICAVSGYLNWHTHARSKEEEIKGTAGSMRNSWTQSSIFERWVFPPLKPVHYHRPREGRDLSLPFEIKTSFIIRAVTSSKFHSLLSFFYYK